MKINKNLTDIIKILTHNMVEIEQEVMGSSNFAELTQKQLHYLEVISELKNPNLSELAKELRLSKPSITAIVDKLIEAGFIRKVQFDEDRRVSHIHMTTKGKEIEKIHDNIHNSIAGLFVSKLNKEETRQICNLLNKIFG